MEKQILKVKNEVMAFNIMVFHNNTSYMFCGRDKSTTILLDRNTYNFNTFYLFDMLAQRLKT